MAAKKSVLDSLKETKAASRKVWRRWLERNHATSPGIWLVYQKRASGLPSVTYAEAVEEALCFGWIDSKLQSVDDNCYRQVFTPRKPTSVWSGLNKTRVKKMIDAGLMTEAGLRAVEIAKGNGCWEALDSIDTLQLPPDFAKALAANPPAQANFDSRPTGFKKAALYRLRDAKTPETRTRRIDQIIRSVVEGGTAGFPRRPLRTDNH